MQLCLLPAFPTLFVVAALWTQSFLVHLYLSAVSRLSLSSNKQPLWAEIYEWECTRKSSVSGSSRIMGGDPQRFPGFFFVPLIPCVGLQTINVTTCHRCMGLLVKVALKGGRGDGFPGAAALSYRRTCRGLNSSSVPIVATHTHKCCFQVWAWLWCYQPLSKSCQRGAKVYGVKPI